MWKSYKRLNSSVRMFLEDCCEPLNRETATKYQTTGRFWDCFKRWCADQNYYTPSKMEFKREMAQAAGVEMKELTVHSEKGNFYPFVVAGKALEVYGSTFVASDELDD